jgi:putative ABC transport system permease protein
MIRGRLVAINDKHGHFGYLRRGAGQPDCPARVQPEPQRRRTGAQQIVAGTWVPEEPDGLSVEEGLARDMGLKLGDRLRFDIAGQLVQARITTLRKVDWGSMRANFFVIFPRSAMPELPATYISAFRAPAQPGFDSALSREFPNITSVDVSASIAQVQRVLDQVIRAVEFLFGFTLVAGLVVLFAAITATREARAREFAIMRALGAGSRLLGQVQRAELLGVGRFGGPAGLVWPRWLLGWLLARYVPSSSPGHPHRGCRWRACAGRCVLALLAGWWGLREVLRRPVLQTLRRAGAM